MSETATPSADNVAMAIAAAYAAAGLKTEGTEVTISPLRLLIAAQPLVVNEVSCLTRHTAATYLAARAGRDMVTSGDSTVSLAGFLYANTAGGWILVNQGDPLVRRRFTVAHELGHFLLHFMPLIEAGSANRGDDNLEFDEELAPPDDSTHAVAGVGRITIDYAAKPIDSTDVERFEDEANRFAAGVLMPEKTCRALTNRYTDLCGARREVLARRLASEFLVSQQAIRRRLADLGLP
ncbi:MAG: ImmA/IrrE family metallo-endopeptidase [Chloroflexota bacterium]|nr:MAG: ImmA/IrrE family metallo-endopeptidase [Chloroflexota bacterium]